MKPKKDEIREIVGRFGLEFAGVTGFYDTSHGDGDLRLSYDNQPQWLQ